VHLVYLRDPPLPDSLERCPFLLTSILRLFSSQKLKVENAWLTMTVLSLVAAYAFHAGWCQDRFCRLCASRHSYHSSCPATWCHGQASSTLPLSAVAAEKRRGEGRWLVWTAWQLPARTLAYRDPESGLRRGCHAHGFAWACL